MQIKTIGRFRVDRKLDEGSQGSVYLCMDDALQRWVAIKLLDKSNPGSTRVQSAFLNEVRSMSKIQHPNIVSIYEVGNHNDCPYLVCEYVEGELLSERLRRDSIALSQVLDIIQGVLDGMCQAHRQGIVHGDLKPANIILNYEDVPKVMDFGIARTLTAEREFESGFAGTPRYIAPEYVQDGTTGKEMDVFALGLILAEMLTGQPVFNGNDRQEVLDNICYRDVEPPSVMNEAVDECLDSIVLKALGKDPDERYPSAEEMLAALKQYRAGCQEPDETLQGSSTTVDFLLRRMKRKSNFPALSGSVRSLNAIAAANEKDVNQISSVIVKDFSLTNKILQVVNSAFYGSFSGTIGTISRAVVVLGIQPIRSLAASLVFFEHLHNKAHAKRLKELVSASLFSAVVARELALAEDKDVGEEYFLAGMLHDLGRLLIAFYLPDESGDVDRLITHEKKSSKTAEHGVLGVTYEQVGQGIARHWNFPDSLINSMHRHEINPGKRVISPEEHKCMAVCFANDMSQLINEQGLQDTDAITALFKEYKAGLGLSDKRIEQVMQGSIAEFTELVQLLVPASENSFIKKLAKNPWTSEVEDDETAGSQAPGTGASRFPDELSETTIVPDGLPPSDKTDELLTEGLQEVTGMLVEGRGLTQICNVVLETLYRAMGFQRVVLSLRCSGGQEIAGRLGFGEDVEGFIPRFRFSSTYSPNIFNAAIENCVDVYIADTSSEKMQADIPDWYKQISDAGSFLIFPIALKKRPLGLIYADHPQANVLDMDSKRLNLIKALRNQIVLAFQSQ